MEKTHTPTLPREIDVDLHLTDPQRYRVRQGTDGNQRDLAYALAARYNAHSALVLRLTEAVKSLERLTSELDNKSSSFYINNAKDEARRAIELGGEALRAAGVEL